MPSEFETVITDQTEYGTVITTQGAAIIADCILNGTKLPIVEARAGDGGGAPTVPVPGQTALVNERWRGEIVGKELSSTTPNMIDVKIVIGDDVGGFIIREMGLFSDTGVLIAVCNTPDTEKVSISAGVSGKLTMIMHIVVADASVLDFVINPSLDTVNREELEKALEEHNADAAAHPAILAAMAEIAASATGGIKKTIVFTIAPDDWQEDAAATNGYGFYYDLVDADIVESMTPNVTIAEASLSTASLAGMCAAAASYDGYVRLKCVKRPESEISASCTLFGRGELGTGGISSILSLPPASAETRGGVIIEEGSGLKVDKDGRLSVDVAADEAASDAVGDVFDSDGSPT